MASQPGFQLFEDSMRDERIMEEEMTLCATLFSKFKDVNRNGLLGSLLKLSTFFLFAFCLILPGKILARSHKKAHHKPIKLHVLVASYNNEKWYEKNLSTIFSQKYTNWTLRYINDCSTDNTGPLVEEYVAKNNMQDKCTIVHNSTNKGAMANFYDGIWNCNPRDVVVIIDGDDWLPDDGVFTDIARAYKSGRVWITYGTYEEGTGGKRQGNPFTKEVIAKNDFRRHPNWTACHLKTFKAKLFRKLPKSDFCDENGFYKATYDMAMMYPMLEMASDGHIKFMDRLTYTYNNWNALSDRFVRPVLQVQLEKIIRAMPSYRPLRSLSDRPKKVK